MVNFPSPARQPAKRRNLPPPPTAAEAPANLEAPEIAPAPVDGRTARATGRTAQLATRVRPDWLHELKVYAATHRLKLVEVLELGFEALKRQRRNG
jgi:hypothetical protein